MLGRHDRTPHLRAFAKKMRQEPTDAEHKLWTLIRDGKFGPYRFRRQHPIAGYIVDFVCRRANLVVELDGGQHADPHESARDAERTQHLQNLNFRVLRIADHEILQNPEAVIETIYRELTIEEPSP